MHVQSTKYKLCNFGNFAYKQKALIVALKTHIVQYKDKW